ncbi:hypothetical protein L3Q82_001447 [Scortum barcoo]|uniref:Uncharacterized protein n=1 Tax=Scortum barcoo TaxID=214431 RepID=A0ACB8W7Z0_9TELE|nr:hypothetical protein L3Q82_001447 [Scortum barcoo]
MAQEEARVSWKKFFVFLAGRTNGAHRPIVNKFKGMGQTEVSSEEESDYVLVFCPIVSRVGTDIEEALGNVHAGKPAVLMVMHHTFSRDHVVADSRRLVDDMKVPLTADFLFYEGQLLQSDRNTIAFYDIQKFFGVTPFQVSGLQNFGTTVCNLSWKKFFVYLAGNTNGAHQPIVDKFKGMGQTEVSSQEESDYVLVFCPIASRIGTDIEEALGNVHAGKPAVLMVMHHTFSRDHVVAESRRLVDDTKVPLTADFLFYEGQLLKSNRNRIAFHDIQKFFGVTPLQMCEGCVEGSGDGIVGRAVSWKKFFVYLAGRTNGAHQPIVDKFKGMGQIEVSSEEESDYVLVFCPIASRIGTDIEEALGNVHAGKPAVLMVMHHTFSRDHVVADSRRLVDDMKVPLTADFLFYEGRLLQSNRNRIAFYDIQKFFGVTPFQVRRQGTGGNFRGEGLAEDEATMYCSRRGKKQAGRAGTFLGVGHRSHELERGQECDIEAPSSTPQAHILPSPGGIVLLDHGGGHPAATGSC